MKKLAIGLVVTALATLGGGWLLFAGRPASALRVDDLVRDCDTVAVIKCGTLSQQELLQKFDQNAYGDLPKVFGTFGISRDQLQGDFVDGIVWKDGRVTVNGKLVATNAKTIGRWYGAQPDKTRIEGTDRAYIMSVSNFVPDGHTAFVRMVNGEFKFAVIKACGNPVIAQPVPQPKYSCDQLNMIQLNRTTYRFEAKASATNAKIVKYRFEFGDGQAVDSDSAVVEHTYSQPGNYTIRLTALVEADGKIVPATSDACVKQLTVPPPPPMPLYECTSLTAALISPDERRYRYSLTYRAENGATLRNVDFNFGDGQTMKGVTPQQLGNVEHTYAAPGNYTTTATLNFNLAEGVKSVNCAVPISAPAPPRQPPAELPKTGPAADLLSAGAALSSVTAAGYYWKQSRRNLINRLMGR